MSGKLAAQIEEAARSTQRNETMKRIVYDLEELGQRSNKGGSAATAKRCNDYKASHNKMVLQLEELDKSLKTNGLQQFDPTTFLRESDQKTPLSMLVTPKDLGSTTGVLAIGEVLKNLHNKSKAKKNSSLTPIGRYLPEALTSVDKAMTLLTETTLDCDKWAHIPDSLLMLLSDVLEQDDAKTVVEEHHETVKRMQFSADELTEQQQQAVTDGDMKLSETLYFKKITVQEAMVEVYNKAYAALDAHATDSFVGPLKRVHQVHNKVTSEMSAIMQDNEQRRGTVEADLEKLKTTKVTLEADNTSISNQFTLFLKQNDHDLNANCAEVEGLYAQIAELERKIQQKTQDRSQLVEQRITALETESSRLNDCTNFNTFYKQQMDLLEATLHTTEVCEEVSDILDEMLCNGCNALEQSLREVDRAVEDERVKFHESRLSHFRDLYLTLGDLQYKKERNLEELDKKIQHVHIQQELAMETLNPKAKEYSQMKKQLSSVKEEMSSQIQVLDEKSMLHIEAFKPTEVALIEAGKNFSHPVEELKNRNDKRQAKLLEYHTLMSQEEAGGTESPMKSVNDEMKDIDEQRAKMQWKKPPSAVGGSRGSPPGSRNVSAEVL